MKNLKTILFIILVLILNLLNTSIICAQSETRVSFQASPLYSYINMEFGKYSIKLSEGLHDPQIGFSSSLKFEKDLNELFSFNTGVFYELRKNSASSELIYDTTITFIGDPRPYKITATQTYQFIGIPIGININYLKKTKFRIYQSIVFHLSYLLSAKTEGLRYFEDLDIVSYSVNNTNDRTDIIISFSSSVGISKRLNEKLAIKVEPGIIYMINDCIDNSYANQKFFDLKFDIGIVYSL